MWPANTFFPLDLPCMPKRSLTTCVEGLCVSLITIMAAAAAIPPSRRNLLN